MLYEVITVIQVQVYVPRNRQTGAVRQQCAAVHMAILNIERHHHTVEVGIGLLSGGFRKRPAEHIHRQQFDILGRYFGIFSYNFV